MAARVGIAFATGVWGLAKAPASPEALLFRLLAGQSAGLPLRHFALATR
jgi:hypothetical protein